jgi:ABC-type glycerol-3-phosphate transport system substrate-binding protein
MGSVGGVSGLGVLGSGSDPSAAVDLAEFLTRPEVQVSISRGVGGFIPTVLEAMEYLKEDPMDQVIRSGLEVLLGGRIRGIPADIAEWGLAKQIYEGFFHQHLLHSDTLDPQVLREAQADLDSLRGPNR